jgi:hypothetical protein
VNHGGRLSQRATVAADNATLAERLDRGGRLSQGAAPPPAAASLPLAGDMLRQLSRKDRVTRLNQGDAAAADSAAVAVDERGGGRGAVGGAAAGAEDSNGDGGEDDADAEAEAGDGAEGEEGGRGGSGGGRGEDSGGGIGGASSDPARTAAPPPAAATDRDISRSHRPTELISTADTTAARVVVAVARAERDEARAQEEDTGRGLHSCSFQLNLSRF